LKNLAWCSNISLAFKGTKLSQIAPQDTASQCGKKARQPGLSSLEIYRLYKDSERV